MSFFPAWWPWGTSHKNAAPSDDRKSFAGGRSRDLDEDTGIGRGGRLTLNLEGYDARRNNLVAAAIGKAFVGSVVGQRGIVPQAQTSDPEWNKLAESFWGEWVKVPDSRGRSQLADMQRMCVEARLWAGDIFAVITDGGQLQLVEGTRIRTPAKFAADPYVVDGVRLTPEGRALGYYIHERKAGAIDPENFAYRDAVDVIHVAGPSFRPDCLRPVPEAQDVLSEIKDVADLANSINRRARMEADNVAVVKTDEGAGKINLIAKTERNQNATAEQKGVLHQSLGMAKTYYLRPHEDVSHPALQSPGGNYVPYMVQQFQVIGAALRIPGEFLMMHFDASFSASQVALVSAYNTFEGWEEWLKNAFLQRVWNWRIAKAIKDGELPPAPVDYRGVSEWYKVRWVGPRRNWIDPVKQANADRANYNMGVESLAEIARRNTGMDIDDLLEAKSRDIISAIRISKEIERQTGTRVEWSQIINVASSISADATPQPEAKPEPANA